MTSDNIKAGLMLAATGMAIYLSWRAWSGADKVLTSASGATATVGGWVNPVADTNLAYRGVNAVGAWATGAQDYSLGGNAYDAAQEVKTWSANPANPDNPYYRTVSALGEKITGQTGWTLGTAIYDFVNPEAPVYSGTAINAAALQDAARVENAQHGATGSW